MDAKNKINKLVQVNPISKELRSFMVCAETGSILKASEKLAVQQAGLSKMIRRLEDEIGKDLFLRGTRGITLTAYGQTLYASLQKTDEYWRGVYANHIHASFGVSGSFKVVCHTSIASSTFPKFVNKVAEAFPYIQLEFEFMRSLEATQAVAEGRAHLGLVINPVKNPELSVKKLNSEFVALWKSRGNNTKHLVLNPEMFRSAKLREQFAERKPLEISDYETIGHLLASTDMQGLLPSSIAQRYGLTAVGDPLYSAHLSVVIHRKRLAGEDKQPIADLIASAIKNS